METAIEQGDRRLAIGLMAMVLALGAALPAGASQHDEATVVATVTVGTGDPGTGDPTAACILLSTTELDFGTVNFGDWAVSPAYQVDKCTEASQDLYALGNHAFTPTDAMWELVDPSDTGPQRVNEYILSAHSHATENEVLLSADEVRLLLSNMPASSSFDHRLVMPPVGSDGESEVAEFVITWFAVLSDD